MEYVEVRIPITNKMFLIETIDISNSDVLFLIGVYIVEKYKESLNNVESFLQCPILWCNLPLSWKYGHICLECTRTEIILFSSSERFKLQRNFSNLAVRKSPKSLRLTCPWKAGSQKRQIIEKIKNCYNHWQRSPSNRSGLKLRCLKKNILFLERNFRWF